MLILNKTLAGDFGLKLRVPRRRNVIEVCQAIAVPAYWKLLGAL